MVCLDYSPELGSLHLGLSLGDCLTLSSQVTTIPILECRKPRLQGQVGARKGTAGILPGPDLGLDPSPHTGAVRHQPSAVCAFAKAAPP